MRYFALVLAALFVAGSAQAMENGSTQAMEMEKSKPMSALDWLHIPRYAVTMYGDWDTNDDDKLSQEEFVAGFSSSSMFEQMDLNSDGIIDEDELGIALYDYWDYDNDGYVVVAD